MVILFALVAAFFAALGLGFTVIGISLATSDLAGLVVVGIGLFVSYGGYLFGRAAVRTHRELRVHPPSPEERLSRRRNIRHTLIFVALMGLGNLALPLPMGVRVISAVGPFLLLPLVLVVDYEPSKKRRQPPPAG
jgi:hypothetical protein